MIGRTNATANTSALINTITARMYSAKLKNCTYNYTSTSTSTMYYYLDTSVTISPTPKEVVPETVNKQNLYLMYNLKKITNAGSVDAYMIRGVYSNLSYINDTYNCTINYDETGKVTNIQLSNLPISPKMGNITFMLPPGFILILDTYNLSLNIDYSFDIPIYNSGTNYNYYKLDLIEGRNYEELIIELNESDIPLPLTADSELLVFNYIYVNAPYNRIELGASLR